MPFSVVVNGVTYTENNFEGQSYADEATGLPASLEDMVTHVSVAWTSTSTTSLTVGVAVLAFTLVSPFGAFGVGMPVRLTRTSAPTTTYMDGIVTINDGLGAITVDFTAVTGSGTHTDWTLNVGASISVPASSPVSIADGGTGGTSGSVGLGNLTAAVTAIVTTENTPAATGVACYVVGDDEFPQWYDAVLATAVSPVMAVLNRVDGAQDEVEIYDVMADASTRLTEANIGTTGITTVSKNQAGGRFAVGSDSGCHVMEFQPGGLVEIATEFTAETMEALAVGYRSDPPFNHATGGRIPVVACMFVADASPVALIMEDGQTFTQTNTAGGGIAIMDGRVYYANGAADVFCATLDTITGNNWTDAEILGDTTDSNPIFGADAAMDSGGGMLALADVGGLSFAKNFNGPDARNAATTAEVWATCMIDNAINTGWALGEARAIWLANSLTADASNNSNTLVETGTVVSAVVDTSTELLGYSDFSTSNFLTITASSDFLFGTDPDTVIMVKFWLQMASAAAGTQTIMDMEDGVGATNNVLIQWIGGTGIRVSLLFETSSGVLTVDSTLLAADDTWQHVGFAFDSIESVMRLFHNGVEVDRTAVVASTDHELGQADTDVRIGATIAGADGLDDGILSLFHIGASRPDGDWGEFFKFSYESEKPLFVASANCLLNGAADAVTDVSWDAASTKTMAMQSDVINVFTGLERTTDDATPGGWTGTVNNAVAIRTTKGLETVLTGSDEELFIERAAYSLVEMAPLGVSQTALAKMIEQAPHVDAPTSYTRPQYHSPVSLTDGATITWDMLTAPNSTVTLGGNRAMGAPTGAIAGAFYAVIVIQDGTGSRTLSWNAAFNFPGGTAPTMSTGTNDIDIVTFRARQSGNDVVLDQVGLIQDLS